MLFLGGFNKTDRFKMDDAVPFCLYLKNKNG